jgi:hypothetical protein
MFSLFDPKTVVVKATDLSNIVGLVHVEARIGRVPSRYIADRVREYLKSQKETSDVGLEWDGATQSAVLRTFVSRQFPVDAVSYIRGLLGPQAQRFA